MVKISVNPFSIDETVPEGISGIFSSSRKNRETGIIISGGVPDPGCFIMKTLFIQSGW